MRENGSMLFGVGCLSCRPSLLGPGSERSAKPCTPDVVANPKKASSHNLLLSADLKVAEREGFEPPIRFPVFQFSRLAPSTTRPSLRLLQFYYSPRFSQEVTLHSSFVFNRLHADESSSTWVFKTGAINHSATSPERLCSRIPPSAVFQYLTSPGWTGFTNGLFLDVELGRLGSILCSIEEES
jgi:hypothetical protein